MASQAMIMAGLACAWASFIEPVIVFTTPPHEPPLRNTRSPVRRVLKFAPVRSTPALNWAADST